MTFFKTTYFNKFKKDGPHVYYIIKLKLKVFQKGPQIWHFYVRIYWDFVL